MDKRELYQTVLSSLLDQLKVAQLAAQQAHDTATHEENVAENKYDTLGLEAAYLAEGQSKRVLSLEEDVQTMNRLAVTDFDENTPIALGALVKLESHEGDEHLVFLSPVSGGSEIDFQGDKILLVTPESPVGKSLEGAFEGDEVLFGIEGSRQMYEILEVL